MMPPKKILLLVASTFIGLTLAASDAEKRCGTCGKLIDYWMKHDFENPTGELENRDVCVDCARILKELELSKSRGKPSKFDDWDLYTGTFKIDGIQTNKCIDTGNSVLLPVYDSETAVAHPEFVRQFEEEKLVEVPVLKLKDQLVPPPLPTKVVEYYAKKRDQEKRRIEAMQNASQRCVSDSCDNVTNNWIVVEHQNLCEPCAKKQLEKIHLKKGEKFSFWDRRFAKDLGRYIRARKGVVLEKEFMISGPNRFETWPILSKRETLAQKRKLHEDYVADLKLMTSYIPRQPVVRSPSFKESSESDDETTPKDTDDESDLDTAPRNSGTGSNRSVSEQKSIEKGAPSVNESAIEKRLKFAVPPVVD